MNSRYKKFIKSGIIIPVIISVVLSTVFFINISQITKMLPFFNESISLSSYNASDVNGIEYSPNGDTLRKSELPFNELEDNTIIGTALINDNTEIEIIYSANEHNAIYRLNLANDDVIFGQAGGTFLSATNFLGSELKMLNKGDSIIVSAFYGEYTYKVAETVTCNSLNKLYKADDKLSKSLIIYTNAENSIGISDSYYVVVCELVSGAPVKE